MVIRGYLVGHAAREYKLGKRTICGVTMPEGMKENEAFPNPIITPSTKAIDGLHDEDISREEIISQGIVSEEDYKQLENYTYALYQRGAKLAKKQGLILVDTKYEFGKTKDGKIILIDEIHTAIKHKTDTGLTAVLKNYQSKLHRVAAPVYLATNGIINLYTSTILPAKLTRQFILRFVNIVKPVKQTFLNILK